MTNLTNPQLSALQKELLALSEELRRKQQGATTQAELDALLREIYEVFHRSVLVGSLIFAQASDAVTKRIEKATEAVSELKSTLKNIATIKAVVDGVTEVLVLVDKILDALKGVAL